MSQIALESILSQKSRIPSSQAGFGEAVCEVENTPPARGPKGTRHSCLLLPSYVRLGAGRGRHTGRGDALLWMGFTGNM